MGKRNGKARPTSLRRTKVGLRPRERWLKGVDPDRLREGIRGPAGYVLRAVRPQDAPALHRLIPMVDGFDQVEPEMVRAIENDLTGRVKLAFLEGKEHGVRAMAEAQMSGDFKAANALILVGAHPDEPDPVAVCSMVPPGNVIEQLRRARLAERELSIICLGVTKIQALAVDPAHRRHGLGVHS